MERVPVYSQAVLWRVPKGCNWPSCKDPHSENQICSSTNLKYSRLWAPTLKKYVLTAWKTSAEKATREDLDCLLHCCSTSWNTSGNDSSFAVFLVGPPVCWRGSPLHLFYFPSSAYSFQHDWLCRVVGCNSKMATTVTDLIGGKAAESELTKIRCVPANLVFLMKR